MARIEFQSVSLAYGGGGGVTGVDLTVEDGEFVALLGPSGSGKTTLLRLVGGFLRPDQGAVLIGGEPVAGPKAWVPPEKRRLGMVFQYHAVWPHRSVASNVEYPLKLAKVGRSEREERVREALSLVGLEGFAARAPETLSGGQRQRVALARALVMRPAALLLDEPFASLDAALRARLRAELGALVRRTGVTVIHVTHDRTEALALADRVAVLHEGRLVQVDEPRRLYSAPGTPFVARFVSDATLLRVRARGAGRFALEEGGKFEVEQPALQDGDAGPGTLAVRPRDVRLEPGGEGQVRAALFMGDAQEVVVGWRGRELRVQAPAVARYQVGEAVRPVFERGVFFPDG
jgi:iron(III) transport system ATP-binding protein